MVINNQRLPGLEHFAGHPFSCLKCQPGVVFLQVMARHCHQPLSGRVVEVNHAPCGSHQVTGPGDDGVQEAGHLQLGGDVQRCLVQRCHLLGPLFCLLKQAGVFDDDGHLVGDGLSQGHLLGVEASLMSHGVQADAAHHLTFHDQGRDEH